MLRAFLIVSFIVTVLLIYFLLFPSSSNSLISFTKFFGVITLYPAIAFFLGKMNIPRSVVFLYASTPVIWGSVNAFGSHLWDAWEQGTYLQYLFDEYPAILEWLFACLFVGCLMWFCSVLAHLGEQSNAKINIQEEDPEFEEIEL